MTTTYTADGHSGDGDSHGININFVENLVGWQAALVSVGAIAAVILSGNYLTRPIFRFIAMANMRELYIAVSLFLMVSIAMLMTAVGLSPALGTFLAGVVLANSEYRHQLEADIDPMKGMLLGLFFMTVGAGINFVLLAEQPFVILGLVVFFMTVKAIVLYGLASVFKIRAGQKWLMTLGLCQLGEFGFVLLSFSQTEGILPKSIIDVMLLVIAISMLVTPFLFIFREKVIAPLYDKTEIAREADTIDEDNNIIIAGRGRVGGIVDRMLRAAGYKPTVIDFNSSHIDLTRKFGFQTYFGDATRQDLLHAAGVETAKLFIIAIDDKTQINELARYLVKHHPNVTVIARATDRVHVYELWSIGIRQIVRETYDSSLRMGRTAFEALGVPPEAANDMKMVFDETDRARMIDVAGSYDVNKPVYENQEFIRHVRESLEEHEAELFKKMSDARGDTKQD